MNGRTVHAAFRTREIAVPKDLERHLDGILGALHLPSGQLRHDSGGVGIDGDDKDDAADADEALNDVAMGGLLDADDIGGGSGPTGSMYSERPPLRIGKPPVRRKIDAKEWLLKEAENLAAEAGNDPFAVEAFNVATGERRAKVRARAKRRRRLTPSQPSVCAVTWLQTSATLSSSAPRGTPRTPTSARWTPRGRRRTRGDGWRVH